MWRSFYKAFPAGSTQTATKGTTSSGADSGRGLLGHARRKFDEALHYLLEAVALHGALSGEWPGFLTVSELGVP